VNVFDLTNKMLLAVEGSSASCMISGPATRSRKILTLISCGNRGKIPLNSLIYSILYEGKEEF